MDVEIKSVFNAFSAIHEKNNLRIQITSKENEIKNSSHIVLPGVGSYESCVEGLKIQICWVFFPRKY